MNKDWTLVIKPRERLWNVDFRELWRYRDLIELFVRRNIVVQYKQTILGPLWYLIQPALTVLMNMVVFGGIAGMSTDGVPQALFYMAGNVCWFYFADCLNQTSKTFTDNQSMFGKVYFPRLVVPIATVVSNLLRFAIQFGLFAVLWAFFWVNDNYNDNYSDNWGVGTLVDLSAAAPQVVCTLVNVILVIVIVIVIVLLLAGLGLGFGILVSSMTTKYRDLTILFTFIVQLWMYGTPIVYPLSSVPEGTLRLLILANPMTPVVEAFKYVTLGHGYLSWLALGYSLAFMCALLVVGVVVFNKVQRSFMDTV